jgi:hypothetical protein
MGKIKAHTIEQFVQDRSLAQEHLMQQRSQRRISNKRNDTQLRYGFEPLAHPSVASPISSWDRINSLPSIDYSAERTLSVESVAVGEDAMTTSVHRRRRDVNSWDAASMSSISTSIAHTRPDVVLDLTKVEFGDPAVKSSGQEIKVSPLIILGTVRTSGLSKH